jgi:Tol biopolymer transport system component
MRRWLGIGAALGTVGSCTEKNIRECTDNADCEFVQGTCTENLATGHHWCTVVDPDCPSGFRWSEALTGDDLAGVCVADDPAPDAAPPCDGAIAWLSNVTGQPEIRVAALDGSTERALTTDGGVQIPGAVWSPDGQRLAFARGDFIWVIDFDGSNEMPLTSGGPDRRPRWSPDGTRIAFDRNGSEVWTVNSNGTGAIPLTKEAAYAPEWSPDGTRIAFITSRDRNREVYSVSDTGADPTNLTNSAADDGGGALDQLRWSPDGMSIVFTSDRSGATELWTMRATGASQTNLNTHVPKVNTLPASIAWAHDGGRLFFTDVGFGCVMGGLFVIDVDGANREALFPTSSDCSLDLNIARDGSRLVFSRTTAIGGTEIWISNLDGTGELRFTDVGATDRYPAFRPCPQ